MPENGRRLSRCFKNYGGCTGLRRLGSMAERRCEANYSNEFKSAQRLTIFLGYC